MKPFGVIGGGFTPQGEEDRLFRISALLTSSIQTKGPPLAKGAIKAEVLTAADRHVIGEAVLVGNRVSVVGLKPTIAGPSNVVPSAVSNPV